MRSAFNDRAREPSTLVFDTGHGTPGKSHIRGRRLRYEPLRSQAERPFLVIRSVVSCRIKSMSLDIY